MIATWILVAGTLVLAGAHVAIVAALAARREWAHAVIALFVLPLAPWWGWRDGMRRRAYAWLAGVGIYAIGVAIA